MKHILLPAILVVFAGGVSGTQERQTVRTSASAVLIDVTVLDKDGRPVTDLSAADRHLNVRGAFAPSRLPWRPLAWAAIR